MADWIDKLTDLRRQRGAGSIDEAEFEARRAEIFAERDAARPRGSATPVPPAPSPVAADFPVELPDNPAAPEDTGAVALAGSPQPLGSGDASFQLQADSQPLLRADVTDDAIEAAEPDPAPAQANRLDGWQFKLPDDSAEAPSVDSEPSNIEGPQTSCPSTPEADDPDKHVEPLVMDSVADPVQEAARPPSHNVPTYTPPPESPDAEARRALASPVVLIGGLFMVIGGIALGSMLLHGGRKPEDKAPGGLSMETGAAAPAAAASPLSAAGTAPPSTDAPVQPQSTASADPKIVSGRVATSTEYDGAFTATLSARYANVGPAYAIVASLWRGGVKAGDCGGGVPANTPYGVYRCELNQLPPGNYEFHVGFAGQRPAIYRFKLVARGAAPLPQQTERAAPPPQADIITQPEWVRRPNSETVSRFYPDRAMRIGIEGSTRITCRVHLSGRLVDCVVQSESPLGYDFGAAAIRLAGTLRMRPMLRNGEAVDGGMVTIPIQWRLQ